MYTYIFNCRIIVFGIDFVFIPVNSKVAVLDEDKHFDAMLY